MGYGRISDNVPDGMITDRSIRLTTTAHEYFEVPCTKRGY